MAGEYTITPVKLGDIPAIYRLSITVHRSNYQGLIPADAKEKFERHYTSSAIREAQFVAAVTRKLRDPSYILLAATNPNAEIIGYISSEANEYGRRIRSLFVSSAYQGKGIGSVLLQTTLSQDPRSRYELYVMSGNKGAIALYEKFHFKPVRTPVNKLFYGAPMIRMRREIIPASLESSTA
jgi:ribosomal protein S18 acetylase RimI-like enzyme